MHIAELLVHRRPVFSFEFFPPKTDEGQQTLEGTLEVLRDDAPDFVSMTYGAGGTTRSSTVELTRWIKQDLGIEAMAHLSCVGEPRERLIEILEQIEAAGVENVLALRGDPPRGQTEWRPHPGGLHYSVELIRLITQLFFDNELYFDFVEDARAAGISVPIVPGIMPITNYGQIKRFTEMCGASIPGELERELNGRADDPEAVAELGVAYATLQCSDLLARGAPGVHFYTLNRSPSTRAILAALRAAHPWTRATARV